MAMRSPAWPWVFLFWRPLVASVDARVPFDGSRAPSNGCHASSTGDYASAIRHPLMLVPRHSLGPWAFMPSPLTLSRHWDDNRYFHGTKRHSYAPEVALWRQIFQVVTDANYFVKGPVPWGRESDAGRG